jgi:hypothetical protein
MKRIPHYWLMFSRAAGAAALAVIVTVLAAACGGGSSSAAGSGSPTASASSAFEQAMAFVRCVRAHGVPDFPDPNSDGSFTNPHNDIPPSAARACGHLGAGLKQSATARQQQDYNKELEVARCVRAHGYPTFPDPPSPGSQSQATGSPPGIDLNSPQFRAVQSSCNRRYFGTSAPPGLAQLGNG